jgi:hypothetical protein
MAGALTEGESEPHVTMVPFAPRSTSPAVGLDLALRFNFINRVNVATRQPAGPHVEQIVAKQFASLGP